MLVSTRLPLLLVVDDDPAIMAVVSAILRSAGHEVLAASDVESGLRLYRERPVDAAVIDVRMPGRSGLDLVRALRAGQATARVPTLVMSGRVADRASGIEAGATEFLAKPFEARELLLRVRSLLEPSSGSRSGQEGER